MPGLVHDARRLEHLLERLHRQLHHADAERDAVTALRASTGPRGARRRAGDIARSRRSRPSACLRLERREHVPDLLVDDRLQHALAHRADRPGDLDVGRPLHRACASPSPLERERRLSCSSSRRRPCPCRASRRTRARAPRASRSRSSSCSPPSPSGTFTFALPVRVVVDLEALDAGHQRRHLAGVVDDRSRRRSRDASKLLRSLDLHLRTPPRRRPASTARDRCSISQTRW